MKSTPTHEDSRSHGGMAALPPTRWSLVARAGNRNKTAGIEALFKFDVAAVLLADLRRAVEVKDNAAVKTLAPKIIADWQDVPAMTDVVKQAKEMLQGSP